MGVLWEELGRSMGQMRLAMGMLGTGREEREGRPLGVSTAAHHTHPVLLQYYNPSLAL